MIIITPHSLCLFIRCRPIEPILNFWPGSLHGTDRYLLLQEICNKRLYMINPPYVVYVTALPCKMWLKLSSYSLLYDCEKSQFYISLEHITILNFWPASLHGTDRYLLLQEIRNKRLYMINPPYVVYVNALPCKMCLKLSSCSLLYDCEKSQFYISLAHITAS